MQQKYGPNSVQCERFVELVGAMTPDQWRELQSVRMGRFYKRWAERRDAVGDADPWPTAMEGVVGRWPEGERDALLIAMGSMMDAVVDAAPARLAHATDCLELARQAASVVFVRPWTGEELFEDLYGDMAAAIPIEALGEPEAVQTPPSTTSTPIDTSLPSRQPAPGLARDLWQVADVEIREDGTYRAIVGRRGAGGVDWELRGAAGERADPPDDPDGMEYLLADGVPRLVHLTVGTWDLVLRTDDNFAMRPAR